MLLASDRARHSFEGPQRSVDQLSQMQAVMSSRHLGAHDTEQKTVYPEMDAAAPPLSVNIEKAESSVVIPITVSPATPDGEEIEVVLINGTSEAEKEKERPKKERKNSADWTSKSKRSMSSEGENRNDTTKTKKVQQMFKDKVHKGRAGITAVSKKIGRNGGLRRTNSTPSIPFSFELRMELTCALDFHAVLRHTSYQASSIHSRRRLSSIIQSQDRTPTASPPPPPSVPPPPTRQDFKLKNDRLAKENRLLSELWLMSAATFRRLGKIDQAKGSIQEAEVKDQTNPNVWVQVNRYILFFFIGLFWHLLKICAVGFVLQYIRTLPTRGGHASEGAFYIPR